jgi:hypothetical protein
MKRHENGFHISLLKYSGCNSLSICTAALLSFSFSSIFGHSVTLIVVLLYVYIYIVAWRLGAVV